MNAAHPGMKNYGQSHWKPAGATVNKKVPTETSYKYPSKTLPDCTQYL